MKDGITTCRLCGAEIGIIPCSWGRRIAVNLQACWVVADPKGEDYVRVDGSKIKGRAVDYENAEIAEPAYRQHRKTCRGTV